MQNPRAPRPSLSEEDEGTDGCNPQPASVLWGRVGSGGVHDFREAVREQREVVDLHLREALREQRVQLIEALREQREQLIEELREQM